MTTPEKSDAKAFVDAEGKPATLSDGMPMPPLVPTSDERLCYPGLSERFRRDYMGQWPDEESNVDV